MGTMLVLFFCLSEWIYTIFVFFLRLCEKRGSTHNNMPGKVISVRGPQVRRRMLLERVPRVRPDEFERSLGVDPDGDPGAYFPKGGRGLVDLDVEMVILEETEG